MGFQRDSGYRDNKDVDVMVRMIRHNTSSYNQQNPSFNDSRGNDNYKRNPGVMIPPTPETYGSSRGNYRGRQGGNWRGGQSSSGNSGYYGGGNRGVAAAAAAVVVVIIIMVVVIIIMVVIVEVGVATGGVIITIIIIIIIITEMITTTEIVREITSGKGGNSNNWNYGYRSHGNFSGNQYQRGYN